MRHLTPPTLHSLSLAAALALSALLGGCGESMVPVEVTGYNHMNDRSILGFSVNGAGGPNLGLESGGGGFNCCIQIPTRWHPGLKAKVSWAYGTLEGRPPPPPPQEAEVEIPEYTEQGLGTVQVHFYPNHRIKVVVSRFGIESPCGPLHEQEKLPWHTRKDLIEDYTTGDGKYEYCPGLRP